MDGCNVPLPLAIHTLLSSHSPLRSLALPLILVLLHTRPIIILFLLPMLRERCTPRYRHCRRSKVRLLEHDRITPASLCNFLRVSE